MRMTARYCLGLAVAASALAPMTLPAMADWPERPLRIIVAFGAGGGTDNLARMVAEPLAVKLGQPVIIENRPGAGGTVGAEAAAQANPDGYSLYMMANGHAVGAAMYRDLPYDAVNDFQAISLVATLPLAVIAHPDFEANNLEELIALATERPGELNYSSIGVGSSQHFAGALLAEVTGIDMFHIPYQNTPEALAAVLSGEVEMLVEVLSPVLGQIHSGDVKALVQTGATRHPNLPDTPTVAESGYASYDVATWYGLAYPAGTPEEIAGIVHAALLEVLEDPALQARALEAGFVINASSSKDFADHIAGEVERWSEVRESAGIEQL